MMLVRVGSNSDAEDDALIYHFYMTCLPLTDTFDCAATFLVIHTLLF